MKPAWLDADMERTGYGIDGLGETGELTEYATDAERGGDLPPVGE